MASSDADGAPQPKFCPQCAAPVESGKAKFCSQCAAPLDAAASGTGAEATANGTDTDSSAASAASPPLSHHQSISFSALVVASANAGSNRSSLNVTAGGSQPLSVNTADNGDDQPTPLVSSPKPTAIAPPPPVPTPKGKVPPPPPKRASAIVVSAAAADAATAASSSAIAPVLLHQGSGVGSGSFPVASASSAGAGGSGQFSTGSGGGGSGQFSQSSSSSSPPSGATSPTGATASVVVGKLHIKPAPASNNTRSAAALLAAAGGPGGSLSNLNADKTGSGTGSGTFVKEVFRTAHVTYDPATGSYKGLPKEWEEALKKQFGLPCTGVEGVWVSGYEHRIPFVLVELRKQLISSGGLTTEGIFRIAPDAVACAAVKKKLDSGTFAGCSDPHICSNLIKVWFRDLPSHLLSIDPDLMLIPDGGGSDEKNNAAVAAINKALNALPEPNRSIAGWLLDLSVEVVKQEKANRMTPKAMAVCLSPNLYKLPAVTAQTSSIESLRLIDLQKRVNTFWEKAIAMRIVTGNPTAGANANSAAASNGPAVLMAVVGAGSATAAAAASVPPSPKNSS